MSGIFDQVINYTPNSLITGGVIYKGTWSAATNTPTLVSPTDSTTLGSYYVVSEAGTRFSLDFNIGDWVISNGSTWQKVDNTDAVSSVFTRTGAVVAANGDYTASNITNVPSGNISAVTVQAALNELDGDISAAQEILTATVTNAESTAITRGQVVYVFSATGNRISVKLASNASEATSSKTFGVVTDASIAAGTTGLVTCVGTVSNLSIGSFTDGQTVYLGTAGAFTSTKPSAPAHLVYVGFIERANAGNGELYVKIQNGYELDELHDVAITGTPAAGSFIIRDATNSLWKNATLTAGTNIAVTNADAAVTVGLTGTVAVANGGTGVTTSTGSGNNVLSTSPTITSPTITGGALNGTLGATTPSTVAGTTGTFSSTVSGTTITANGGTYAAIRSNGSAGGSFQISKASTDYGVFYGNESNTVLDSATSPNLLLQVGGVTKGTFTSTGLNSTAIGATTPSTGAFTTLSATSTISSGVAATTQGYLKLYSTGAGAREANLYSPAGGGLQIDTNSNSYPVTINGSQINLSPAGTDRAVVSSTGLAITGTLSTTGAAVLNSSTTSLYGLTVSGDGATYNATIALKRLDSTSASGQISFIGNTGTQASRINWNGPIAASFTHEIGGTVYSSLTSSGLAITGTLSATGNTTIGSGGTAFLTVTNTTGTGGTTINAMGGPSTGNFKSADSADTAATRWTFGRDNQSTGDFVWYENGSARMKISTGGGLAVTGTLSATGNASIGTTSSYGKLTVYDTTNTQIALTDSTLGASYGGAVRGYGVSGLGGYAELGVLDAGTYRKGIRITEQTNSIQFFTASSSTERMRIDSSGNVGIGTASPASKLDVNGNTAITGTLSNTNTITVSGTSATGATSINLNASDYSSTFTSSSLYQNGNSATGTTCGLANAGLGSLYFQNVSNALIWTNSGVSMVFGTSSAERMRINATGLAVTGTTQGSGLFKIGTGTFTTAVNTSGVQFDTSTTNSGIEWVASPSGSGYGHRMTDIDSGAGYAAWKLQGRTNSGTFSTVLQVDGTTGLAVTGALTTTGNATLGTTGAGGGALLLYGGSSGATLAITPSTTSGANGVVYDTSFIAGGSGPHIFKQAGTEYFRISNSGISATGAGTAGQITAISAGATGNAGFRSSFDGSIQAGIEVGDSGTNSGASFAVFRNSGGSVIGNIARVGTTNAVVYNTTSDARLKENLRDFTDSGRLIDGLKPRVFDWKDSDDNGKGVIGFIAQEEHAADPIFAHIGAISVGDNDPTTITKQWQRSDAALIPILVAELQSLRKRLAALESK